MWVTDDLQLLKNLTIYKAIGLSSAKFQQMRVSSCLCLILFRAVDIGLGLAPQLHMTLGSKKLD